MKISKYYVISDLHGKKGIIDIIKKIILDYNIDGKNSKLIINGDCIDGGKYGFKLLYYIKELSDKGIAIMLRGNHERFFLDWIKSNDSLWILNDYNQYGLNYLLKDSIYKDKTFKNQYGVLLINGSVLDGTITRHLRSIIKDEHSELIEWIANLNNMLVLDDFIVVHAGLFFDENDENAWLNTDARYMESIDPRDMSPNNSGKWLVLGHFWATHFHKSLDIYVSAEDKRIQIDGNILSNKGQLNMLEINNEDGTFVKHNNI